jgi:hypothetical protein
MQRRIGNRIGRADGVFAELGLKAGFIEERHGEVESQV